MSEGVLSERKVSLQEKTYLFAREIISCAKLHIFRQMAPNYTKKMSRKILILLGLKADC